MQQSTRLDAAIQLAISFAQNERHEFVTPEHVMLGLLSLPQIQKLIASYQASCNVIEDALIRYIKEHVDSVPGSLGDYDLRASTQLMHILEASELLAKGSGRSEIDVLHFLRAMINLPDSYAVYLLAHHLTSDIPELFNSLDMALRDEELPLHAPDDDFDDDFDDWDIPDAAPTDDDHRPSWRALVTCINDLVATHNPLIGREAELDRTIQVLCRCDKNNPLHVGESGVGKTALVYGLAARIERGDVPERLRGSHIYQMDMGSMVAGTSYRGDFEKRIKSVMEGAQSEGNAIIYIDEIHNLVGAGATSDSSLDGSNILKPYLESGQLRFIGSTTYKEYNRYFQKSQGLVRRFQQIDIPEPSVEEAVLILDGLKRRYEQFHGVRFADGVIRYAVEAAARHITERFLPDKAIDLIDEAGAYRQMHPLMRAGKPQKTQWVKRDLIDDVLARICKVDPKAMHDDDAQQLESLETRLRAQIYGQDVAIRSVVEAVLMGKAGLLDEQKPIASLLFVGPTGVGKTEVCRVLAQELGTELVRFDMSEYTEKHTVAKLIGSPAGYVGYEEGGLLTDAIRRSPNCVLLLDEIEKAHPDIYNILLQVMDYARLTDNKGQRADFRRVILIMTSNAGAQYAHQANVGFGSTVSAGEAMLTTVRKTFKPEFLARLSSTVVFRDMDRPMATLILQKKLRQLSDRLLQRHVTMQLTPAALDLLLSRGFTPRNGAREMDRQINQLLSPLLMREILFGRLKGKGGDVTIDAEGDQLLLKGCNEGVKEK